MYSGSGRKRQPVRTAQDSSSSEDSYDSASEEEECSDVDSPAEDLEYFDFEGQPIHASDYHGIKKILQEVLPSGLFKDGQIVEEIIAQESIGSVIKNGSQTDEEGGQEVEQEEEASEDALGVTTVLILNRIKNSKLCQQIKDFLRNQSDKFGKGVEMEEVLGKRMVGWLIHERFPSIPEGIAEPLLSCLKTELDKQLGKEKHNLHLVGITRAYQLDLPSNNSKKQKKKKKKKLNQSVSVDQLGCVYPEMEHALKKSIFTFTWPLASPSDEDLPLMCVCYVLDYAGLKSLIQAIS